MRPIFGAIMAFRLVSNAFTNNDLIPVKFTADGHDISPQLSWSDPPANTVSFALVLEDRDAKPGKIHWVLWNLPATRHVLPKKIASDPVLPDGTCQGLNDFNKVGYIGPRLSQVTTHKYEFTLYALDSKLDLRAGSSHAELKAVMGGHIIAQAQLVGRYKPERDDARLRALENDKEYVNQSNEIKLKLKEAYNARRQEVAAFFRRFRSHRRLQHEKSASSWRVLTTKKSAEVLRTTWLLRIVFSIQFLLKTNPLTFKTVLQPSYGNKFHVKIVGDHLEPGKPAAASEDTVPGIFQSKRPQDFGCSPGTDR